MRTQVIAISTAAFRKLKKYDSDYVSWSDERPGSTQKILMAEDAYIELIDLAIAKRKTLDAVILEVRTSHWQGQDVLTMASTVSRQESL